MNISVLLALCIDSCVDIDKKRANCYINGRVIHASVVSTMYDEIVTLRI